jgi:peroxiredoxin
LIVLVATVAIGQGLFASSDKLERRLMVACTVTGAISLTALIASARVARFALGESAHEIKLGHPLPHAIVKDEQGRLVELSSLAGRPMLLIFYRGGWCPSCRAQLTALLPEVVRYLNQGVRVVGVSPDSPEISLRWSRELGLPFQLLSDESQRLAPDLCGGSAHCQLLVDKQGVVRWGALTDNWRVNAPPAAILQAAYRLQ